VFRLREHAPLVPRKIAHAFFDGAVFIDVRLSGSPYPGDISTVGSHAEATKPISSYRASNRLCLILDRGHDFEFPCAPVWKHQLIASRDLPRRLLVVGDQLRLVVAEGHDCFVDRPLAL
jgi:hypothetical protein